jgi:hypothetical protein
MAAATIRALGENLSDALAQVRGADGVRILRWALRELPLDGGTVLAIAERLADLEEQPTQH